MKVTAVLPPLAIALALVVLNLALEASLSFDGNTCDTGLSCADLYITCQGAYLCQDDACEVMMCFGAPEDGPRHGGGFVWTAGVVLVMLYALTIVRRMENR